VSVIQPPTVGPSVGPTITPTPKIAIAVPYSSRGNSSYRIACDVESSAPPPRPWMIRQNTSAPSAPALPHMNDAIVERAIEPAQYRRRPKYAESHTVIGSTITLATM